MELDISFDEKVSTHSRAEAAANFSTIMITNISCFNTQPRGGGCGKFPPIPYRHSSVSTHSRAEAAASIRIYLTRMILLFQHTAARRRLLMILGVMLTIGGFNTQPRGGGCEGKAVTAATVKPFQHTAARRRLRSLISSKISACEFQHTAARRRLRLLDVCRSTNACFNTQPRGGGCDHALNVD